MMFARKGDPQIVKFRPSRNQSQACFPCDTDKSTNHVTHIEAVVPVIEMELLHRLSSLTVKLKVRE